jgi:iron(III) transport system permease protein
LIVRPLLIAWCLLLALPVASVLASWLAFDASALGVLQHQLGTVLPGYALQSLLLALGVALGTAVLGVATAVAVTLFRFPGRGFFEWALLLPMAMPAYVLAYAATDALQPSGLAQTALREAFGWLGSARLLAAETPQQVWDVLLASLPAVV